MELRLNVLFLSLVALAALGMTSTAPMAALDPSARATRLLGQLEDRFSREPGAGAHVVALCDAYLDRGRPELAVSTVRRAREPASSDAEVLHRLARAEESLGRFSAARDAASAAVRACVHAPDCAPHRRVLLVVHQDVLERIVRMGVRSAGDARIDDAYAKAMRRTSVRASVTP